MIWMKGYEMTEMRRAQNPWDNARETPLFQIMKLHLYKEFRLILIWIFGWISGVPKILRSDENQRDRNAACFWNGSDSPIACAVIL